ncbi:MAG: hypothetical protein OFPII_27410 [Osedax symbiont Rs1]|nr:MAG: hypothetical protein OFPII_27410 [Osedax symbiont Rs1]
MRALHNVASEGKRGKNRRDSGVSVPLTLGTVRPSLRVLLM